ncbi:MAG TPA: A24 family peptidase [Planktothrix sp.]
MIHVEHDKLILQICALVVAIVAAIIDVRTTKIPNVITFPATIIALIMRALFGGFGMDGLLDGFLGALLGIFLTYFGGGMRKKMYFGDSKLMMACGAFLGWVNIIIVMMYFSICWGAIAVWRIGTVIPWKSIIGSVFAQQAGGDLFSPEDAKKVQARMQALIPIGPAIAVGVLITELFGQQTLEFMGLAK